MPGPHYFANRTFVIGGLILFAGGLFLIANRHNLLGPNLDVYTEFDRLNGLQQGAKVRVSGMDAGEVLETRVPSRPDGQFRLKLRIDQKFRVLVRGDSIAFIKTAGLGGGSFVEIQKGTQNSPELPSGGTIPGTEPFELSDLIQLGGDVLRTVQTNISALQASTERALQSIDLAAHQTDRTVIASGAELQKLLSSARQASDEAGKTFAEAGNTFAEVEQGRGTIGKLLKDPALAEMVDETVRNARQSTVNLNEASAQLNVTAADFQKRDLLGRVQAMLDNSRQLTETLNRAVSKLTSSPLADESTATDLRDTIANARAAMVNLAENTEALKHNFLVRGFFKKRGYYSLDQLTTAQYLELLKEHSFERVWLSRNELFSARPDGNENLTKYGEARIETGMNGFIPYLPKGTIVVEGYARQGSRSQRFIRAKQRADAVQSYITKRFGLLPGQEVEAIPARDSLASALGKSGWDGISLVMLR
jgi:phospholipid/cholesterol/gamma-HCH transport system substrate-binding protein